MQQPKPPTTILPEDKRNQLDGNIRKMLDNGASNDDVKSYAADFKSKFGVKKKDSTSEVTVPEQSLESNGAAQTTSSVIPETNEYSASIESPVAEIMPEWQSGDLKRNSSAETIASYENWKSQAELTEDEQREVEQTFEDQQNGDFGVVNNITNWFRNKDSSLNPFYNPEATTKPKTKDELIQEKVSRKRKDFLNDLDSPEKREKIKTLVQVDNWQEDEKRVMVDRKITEGVNKLKQLDQALNPLLSRKQELESIELPENADPAQVEQLQQEYKSVTESLNTIQAEGKKVYEEYEESMDAYAEHTENLGRFEDELSMLKRDYQFLNNAGNILGLQTAEIASDLLYQGNRLGNSIANTILMQPELREEQNKEFQSDAITSRSVLNNQREQLTPTVTADQIEGVSDFIEFATNGFLETTPTLIQLGLPVVGQASFFASQQANSELGIRESIIADKKELETINQYLDNPDQYNLSEQEFIDFAKRKKQLQEQDNSSEGSILLASGAMAASELLLGRLGKIRLVKKAKRTAQSVGQNTITAGIKENYKSKLLAGAIDFGKDVAGEGIEELGVGIVGNLSDIYLLDRKFNEDGTRKNILDGAYGNTLGGLSTGGILSGARKVLGFAAREISDFKRRKAVVSNIKEIESLSQTLKNPDLSPELRESTEKRISALNKKNGRIIKNVAQVFDNLNKEDNAKLIEINNNISAREIALEDLEKQGKVDGDLAKSIQNEINALDGAKSELLDTNSNPESEESVLSYLPEKQRLKYMNEAENEIQNQYKKDGVEDYTITDAEIKTKAEEIIQSKSNNDQISEPTDTDGPSDSTDNAIGLKPNDKYEVLENNQVGLNTDYIDDVISDNPKILKVGDKDSYIKYLNTIFPDSKVKNVLIRQGSVETDNKLLFASAYKDYYSNPFSTREKNYLLFNVKNPNILRTFEEIHRGPKDNPLPLESGKFDSIVVDSRQNLKNPEKESGLAEVAVLRNSENIYHLGSEKDIQGFKNFINIQVNETQAQGDIAPNESVRPESSNDIQQGKDSASQPTIDPTASEGEVVKSKVKNGVKEVFGVKGKKGDATVNVVDKMIGQMAKRSGISKKEMSDKISFEKTKAEEIKKLPESEKVLYQIVGENANLNNNIKTNLEVARSMETSGKDADAIFLSTGWQKGTDGKWKYDMPEGKVSIDFEGKDTLSEMISYDALFEAYPDAKDIKVRIENSSSSIDGQYVPEKNEIFVNMNRGKKEAELTLIHEIQHWIQEKENFAKGGSPQIVKELINRKIQEAESKGLKKALVKFKNIISSPSTKRELVENQINKIKQFADKDDHALYESLAGEVEARNVETRYNLSEKTRAATPIRDTEDVAQKEQLLLFQGEKGAMLAKDGEFLVYALTDPNLSTPLHEMAHIFEHYLSDSERKDVLEWSGQDTWTRETSENFARGFEKYLADGKAPNKRLQKIFDSFKEWFTEIYDGIANSEIDVEISPKMKSLYDSMIVDPKKAKPLKIGRGKVPLDKRVIKDKTMLKALEIEVDNAFDIALQFFISGGRMQYSGLKEVIATTSKKSMSTEGRSRSQYIRTSEKGGFTFNDIIQKLVDEDTLGISQSKYRDALIDVISQFNTPKAMAIALVGKYNEQTTNENGSIVNESGELLFETPLGFLTKNEIDDLEKNALQEYNKNQSFLYNLSEQELNEYYEESKKAETNDIGGRSGQQNEGGSTKDVRRSGVQKESSKDRGKEQKNEKPEVDSFISAIDSLIKDIDDSTQGTLGMNLAPAVAKAALLIVKNSYNAGKTVAQAIQDAIDYIKSTDSFKKLSKEEKNNTLREFEKTIVQQNKTPEQNRQYVEDVFKANDAEINKKKPLNSRFRESARKVIEKYSDRQFVAKVLVDRTGMQSVKDLMINGHGSSGKAKRIFEKGYKDIYADKVTYNQQGLEGFKYEVKPMSQADRVLLDKIIMLKRFIAIDKHRKKNGLPPVTHSGFINGKISQDALDGYRAEVGDKKFMDLEKRSKAYFKVYAKVLKDMYDNGLISKESYDSLNGTDYQPRQFLQHITDFEGNVSLGVKVDGIKDTGGLAKDQINSLKEGSEGALIRDSEWLLSTTIAGRYKAMAMNNVNKKFIKDAFPKAKKQYQELKKKPKKNWSKEDRRFAKYFKELSSKIIDNPVISIKENKNQTEIDGIIPERIVKHKYDKTPDNFKKAYYYEDGVKGEFFIEENLHDSWFDNLKGLINPDFRDTLATYSGSKLLKAIATGNNPSFPIVNTPRDFTFLTIFSNQYSSFLPKAMFQVGFDSIKAIRQIAISGNRDVSAENLFNKYIEYGGDMTWLSTQGRIKEGDVMNKLILKVLSPRVKHIGGNIFDAATLQSLSTYSEMMFRIALMDRTMKNELKSRGFKDIANVKDKAVVDEIYNRAVADARSILDFNQGGAYTKDLESVIPYINTAVQGTRVMADAIAKEPVKVIFKMAQAGALFTGFTAGISFLMIALFRDYDDEEDKDLSIGEIYLKGKSGISQYKRIQYGHIFTGRKNEDGEYEHIQIAKTQPMTPIFSLTDNAMDNFVAKLNGVDTKKSSVSYADIGTAINNNLLPFDMSFIGALLTDESVLDGFADSFVGTATRNPALKAGFTYATNYDFYRKQNLTYDTRVEGTEGYEDKNIEDFYKKFAKANGVSPSRLKGAVESLITTPSTNPFVGMLYGGADYLSSSDGDLKDVGKEFAQKLKRSTLKRMVNYTSEFNRQINKMKPYEAEINAVRRKNRYEEVDMRNDVSDAMSEKITIEEFDEKSKKYNEDIKQNVGKEILKILKKEDVNPFIMSLKFESDKEVRAMRILRYYGDIDEPNFKSTEDFAKMFEMKILDQETMGYYLQQLEKLKKE